MTLSNHLISNYAEHPAFKVVAPVFAVPDVLLSSFNESYLALSQMASTLGSLSSSQLQRTCRKTLSEIFGLMSAQVADKQEAFFFG